MFAFSIAPALAVLAELTERNKQDLDLLGRIQRRDERALSALYDRYGSLLYTVASRIVSAPSEAENIVQDVFVQVWTKSNQYTKERGSVYSWVVALCRNNATERVRSKRHKQQSKETASTSAPSLFASANTDNLRDYSNALSAAKNKLSDSEITLLDMSYFGGYSQSEISQMLKMPIDTVKATMRQGMMKLRRAVTGDTSAIPETVEPEDTSSEQSSEGAQQQHRPRRRRGRRGGRNRRRGGRSQGSQSNSGPQDGGSAS